MLREDAEHVSAHDHFNLFFSEAFGEERVRDLREAARVERLRDRAVEIRSQTDVSRADEVRRVTNAARNRTRIRAAGGRLPEAYVDCDTG
jgi:hypothetical protein